MTSVPFEWFSEVFSPDVGGVALANVYVPQLFLMGQGDLLSYDGYRLKFQMNERWKNFVLTHLYHPQKKVSNNILQENFELCC